MGLVKLDIDKFISDVCNNDITIYEDIQGSKIFIRYNGSEFDIYQKSFNSGALSLVDISIQKYYNKAINYLFALPEDVKKMLNQNWYFGFEYFPDDTPANIQYNRVPKNNLILTSIVKGKKYKYSQGELTEYAKLLDVDTVPILFSGKLNEYQKEAFVYFLNTSEDDIAYIFGDNTFAEFFFKLLNPNTKNTFLMYDGEYQKNIEKLIIKIENDTDDIKYFSLLNPLYTKTSITNESEYTEVYTLLLINFMNYCQTINLKELKLFGTTKDELYINLICKLYNMYVNDCEEFINDFNFTIPEFFNRDKFKINKQLINNKLTLDYVDKDNRFEYLFKIILGSLNKKRKNPIGVFNNSTLILFNNFVDNISVLIDTYLGKYREDFLRKRSLINFDDYQKIKYDVDGEDNVYPDIYSEYDNISVGDSKDIIDSKGKKGIKK